MIGMVTLFNSNPSFVSSMLAELTPSAVDTTEVPSGLPLSMNDTDPSGSAVPDVGLTVAVSVTLWPEVDAAGEGTTAVVVDTGDTCSVMAPADAAKFASPEYATVTSWLAVVSYVCGQVTTRGGAGESARPWQPGMGFQSSLNDAVPVGAPDPGVATATVAV